MAVPMVSSPEGSFLRFPRRVASFRMAGVALRDIQTCFVARRKNHVVWQAQYFATFSEDALQFSWQARHLDVSIVILRVRRNTLDASCCVFFANRIGRAASSGDKVQIPWQAWHFDAFCEMC